MTRLVFLVVLPPMLPLVPPSRLRLISSGEHSEAPAATACGVASAGEEMPSSAWLDMFRTQVVNCPEHSSVTVLEPGIARHAQG